MIRSDCHIHSYYSTDSNASMESMIEAAISKGLNLICFTDHMDYGYPHKDFGSFLFNLPSYIDEITRLRCRYNHKIEILFGIELGLRNEPDIKEVTLRKYEEMTKTYPFDYVIGSTHVLHYTDPYYQTFWAHPKRNGIEAYFNSIKENASYYSCFHCYGHLDYIIRYIPDEIKDYRPKDYRDLIDQMLTALIQSGKGIECNTSGLRYKLGFPHPKAEVLKRYVELGGEILTIGSDAHEPRHIAYEFDYISEWLKELGFRYYTIYKEQKPRFEML